MRIVPLRVHFSPSTPQHLSAFIINLADPEQLFGASFQKDPFARCLGVPAGRRARSPDAGPVVDETRMTGREGGEPFSRGYRNLRHDLATGSINPGDQIIVTEVAKRLGISPTPVREALARLVGERLVEDRRHHGYFVPLPSWFELVELYDLCEMHLLAALREAQRDRPLFAPGRTRPIMAPFAGSGPSEEPLALILALSRNARLAFAGRIYLENIAAAMRAEAGLWDDRDAREADLCTLLAAGAWGEGIQAVRREFRVRRSRAEPVAYAMAAAHRARNRPNIV
jgi:hypothetical protein